MRIRVTTSLSPELVLFSDKIDQRRLSCPILARIITRNEGFEMWSFVERAANDVFRITGQLDREHWIVVFAAALIVGAFLLRGLGTRI